MPYGKEKFKRFAVNVWGVDETGKSDEEIALMGLGKLEDWMREIGLVLNSKELGVSEENIDDIVKGVFAVIVLRVQSNQR
jgi:alcohol dehydrogenase YqhD (iron-dependent ADH family)